LVATCDASGAPTPNLLAILRNFFITPTDVSDATLALPNLTAESTSLKVA